MISQASIRKLARFALVGGLGFLTDAGLLSLFLQVGIDPFSSRAISILMAMLVTWRLNRAFTFTPSAGSQLAEAGRYFAVAAAVGLLNYALYAGLLLAVPACPPLLATAISTAVCMLVSFTGYGRLAFRAG